MQDGSNGLNIIDTDGGNFVEMAIPLARLNLGCAAGNVLDLFFEPRSPRRAAASRRSTSSPTTAEQRSSAGGTCFDIGPCAASMPSEYLHYRIDCPVPAQGTSWGNMKALYR